MYKKILCLGLSVAAAIGLAPSALAGNQFIYFGIMPTYSMTNFNWTNADNSDEVINTTNSTTQLGAFIGYGVLIDKVYIGVEGATQFGQRSATSTTQDYVTQAPLNNQLTMSDIYIIDLRPGYVFGDKNTMFYGIIGLNTASFQATQTTNDNVIIQDSGPMRQNGIRIGLGYNLGLGQHFMARAEYVFTKFSDFQFTDTSPDSSETHTWDINPYSNEISLGLSVIFNI